MKHLKFLSYLVIFIMLAFNIVNSQHDHSKCQTSQEVLDALEADSTPYYLRNGFGEVRTTSLAIVYVDFPDGRYLDNGVLKQPLTNSDLVNIQNFDAAAEVGLVNYQTPFPVGNNKFIQAAKYKWKDRWNAMFSQNIYYGSAHPDWASHGDSAYGSFSEYWKEVSNNMLFVNPAITHPNESNIMFKTGIINNYIITPQGDTVISYITLPKNKYGSDTSEAYFPDSSHYSFDFNAGDLSRVRWMKIHIRAKLQSLFTQGIIQFDVNNFLFNNGTLMIVFAGGHLIFKGIADGILNGGEFIVREKNLPFPNINSRFDGLSISAHEFAHIDKELEWGHSNASQFCIMNVYDRHHKDCPQHPNPIYKLRKGWVQAIPLENSQFVDSLPPVEISKKVGVITIYGKPTASGDASIGESYIVENRRRLGFDKKLCYNYEGSAEMENFKGGLLIWKYSNYKSLFNYYHPPDGGYPYDSFIRLETPIAGDSLVYTQNGNPQHMFGYKLGLENLYYNLDSNRTYSSAFLQTGIKISNIQNDTSSFNGNISFDLNYLIHEPIQYDHIIYQQNSNPSVLNLTGNIYNHSQNGSEFYNVSPGTIFYTYRPYKFNASELNGDIGNKIEFKGVGFANYKVKYPGIEVNSIPYNEVDSIIIKNIKIENVNFNVRDLSIINNSYTQIMDLVVSGIELITDLNNPSNYDINIKSNRAVEFSLENMNVFLNGIEFHCDPQISNSNVFLSSGGNGFMKFATGRGMFLTESSLYNVGQTRLKSTRAGEYWAGINLNQGNVNLNNFQIENANTALEVRNIYNEFKINNSTFSNNKYYDIIAEGSLGEANTNEIKNSTFNCDNQNQISSVIISDFDHINIEYNNFNQIGNYGIFLLNTMFPYLKNNNIYGVSNSNNYSTGIFSYNSHGDYHCNEIYQCNDYGIMLDNSLVGMLSNKVQNNGIGVYLINNAIAYMAPSYRPDYTSVTAGYNNISYNAGPEIMCISDITYQSFPEMNKGYNIIEDVNQGILDDTLIYNFSPNGIYPSIKAEDNYWGGGDPLNRLVPDWTISATPYLTDAPDGFCNIAEIPIDNQMMGLESNLNGEVMRASYFDDYESLENYSNQLLSLNTQNKSTIIAAIKLLNSAYKNESNLNQISNLLNSIAGNSQFDFLKRKLRDLSIESKVLDQMYSSAINDYDNVLSNSNNSTEIFYTLIDKSRAVKFILDSLINNGDNSGTSLNLINTVDKIFKRDVNSIFEKINNNNINKEQAHKVKEIVNYNELSSFKSYLENRISKADDLNPNDKRTLIIQKILFDLTVSNYNPNIPNLKNIRLSDNIENIIPQEYSLYQNFPNPFNPVTTISYQIPTDGIVNLKVYDILGKEVATLVSEMKRAGSYQVVFNGNNLASGIYFYKIKSGNFNQVKRMMLIK
ncbi:MAG: T9SS type A sorting domain-containing protein [Ignavibacteria bacterium]|nr:T9SS type A sorting domain-containing protein [Ignavibacteria bacterium]